jgi:Flp pilus assembly protein TadG
MMEFTLVFLPFLAMATVLLDTCWAVFTKCTLQYAVRVGVRTGITLTASQTSNLTSTVKSIVQQNSFGILKNTNLIQVHYLQPPATNSNGAVTDVSTVTTASNPGNSPGNIMVVSINNYALNSLVVRIYNWRSTDSSAGTISVSSADLIEPMSKEQIPPIGTAP